MVNCLKFDNGGEYHSSEFKEVCSENEIKMIKTASGTPKQNDVAKRMNKTLNERVRCMRILSRLPKIF